MSYRRGYDPTTNRVDVGRVWLPEAGIGARRKIWVFLSIHMVALCMGGCVMGGTVEISEPYIDEGTPYAHIDEEGKQVVDGLKISAEAGNYYVRLLFVGPILPIIPMPALGSENPHVYPFSVVVQIEPPADEILFDPNAVVLIYNDLEVRPMQVSEALSGGVRTRGLKASLPGHKWNCSKQIAAQALRLDEYTWQINGDTCFKIDFPVNTPSTTEQFTLVLNGLRRQDQPLYVAPFRFRPSSRSFYNLMLSE